MRIRKGNEGPDWLHSSSTSDFEKNQEIQRQIPAKMAWKKHRIKGEVRP